MVYPLYTSSLLVIPMCVPIVLTSDVHHHYYLHLMYVLLISDTGTVYIRYICTTSTYMDITTAYI